MFYFKIDDKFYFDYNGEIYNANYFDNKDLLRELEIDETVFTKDFEEKTFYRYNYFKVYNINLISNILKKSIMNQRDIILEMFDIVLLVKNEQKLLYSTICNRYIEGIDYNVRKLFKNFERKVFFDNYIDEKFLNNLFDFSKKLDSKEDMFYIDKKDKLIYKERIIPDEPRNFTISNIKLKDVDYLVLETGYREKSERIEFKSGRFSIIKKCFRVDQSDIIGIPVYSGETASFEDNISFLVQGGKGYTDNQSFNSFVGESIERYSARKKLKDNLISDTYVNLLKNNLNVIDPRIMNIDKDNPNIGNFDENKEYEWVKCTNLVDGLNYFVEASFVFFPYYNKSENLFNTQSTTGLSSGKSLEEAILQGMLEVIERDSYSIKHKAKSISSVINRDILDENNMAIINTLKEKGIFCNLLKINKNDDIHVVHCTTQSYQKPIFTHGCGASLDIDTAVRRSILEAIQLRVSQIEISKLDSKIFGYEVYEEWAEGNEKYLDIFLEKNNIIKPGEKYIDSRSYNLCSDINFLINKIESNYILCVDLSIKNLPLKVVRIIVPDYQDIDYKNRKITNRLKKELKNKSINKYLIFS